MSYETNQEWIEANNTKIDSLKSQVNTLPEYQDIKPIYGATDYTLVNSKTSRTILSYYDNFYLLTYNSGAYSYINYVDLYRIKDDGTAEKLTTLGGSSLSAGGNIIYVDYENNFVYCTYAENTFVSFHRYDLVNKTITELSRVYDGSVSYEYYKGINMRQGKISISLCATYGYTCNVDTGKISKVAYNATNCFNDTILWYNGRKTIKNIDNNLTYTSTNVINFVNATNDKIIINNILYSLSDELRVGEVLKENILDLESFSDNILIVNLFGDYYYLYDTTNSTVGTVVQFNENNNTFIEILGVTNATIKGRTLTYKNTQNINFYLKGDKYTKLIGWVIDGVTYYRHENIPVNSNKVASGTVVYDNLGNPINGTMPNNGELNYTPSTSQQTIPEGYTSGGTISAVDATIDSDIQAGNIKSRSRNITE